MCLDSVQQKKKHWVKVVVCFFFFTVVLLFTPVLRLYFYCFVHMLRLIVLLFLFYFV